MKSGLTFSQHLHRLFILSADAVGFMLGSLAIVLGLGFLFGEANTHNFRIITEYSLGIAVVWGVFSLIYGISRLLDVFFDIPGVVSIFTAFIGLNLWLLLLISFTLLDPTPVQATELTLIVPVLVEFWLAVLAIDYTKEKRRGASPYTL